MQKKKLLATLFLPLLLASFLQSQSLGDLAKKEKARRAALKGKHATVVTEADLAKVKRQPAVESRIQEQAAAERAAQAGQAEETAAGGGEAKAGAGGGRPAEGAPPGGRA